MKKILCFILSAVLVFNNALFVYADTSGTIPTPVPTLMPIPSSKIIEILAKIMHPEFGVLEDFFKKDEVKEELDKEGAITYDNDYVYINSTTVNNINNIVQDSVHALDGYWLMCPARTYTMKDFYSDYTAEMDAKFNSYVSQSTFQVRWVLNQLRFYCFDASSHYYYFSAKGRMSEYDIEKETFYDDRLTACCAFEIGKFGIDYDYPTGVSVTSPILLNDTVSNGYTAIPDFPRFSMGQPFKVFYTRQDLQNYLNNGKQRTYAPKLPNVTIKIPVKYINNSVSLPDITYNITTENKTETEIQNQYDITIKNYLDSLDNFTDGTDPTPTPKPDGGFTDGTTPTPTPAIGDGGDDSGNGKVDLSEITDLLKKILDKLTSFADSHSKFEKTITDYIESTDGKLDQIIDAIDKLSQGKEDGEDYKCKYDYTELSDYLKKLWNDSDKKFDTMIDLLEENNEYQQKLVDTLDSIKSILIKESIMDSFKDRSKETANKAKEKFPTSVPWDIAIVINAMSATPEEPKFNLPIKIASLNIDENIEVDLSSGEWAKLAKTCRYMLSLLFILFMVQLSRKLFFNKGDDN